MLENRLRLPVDSALVRTAGEAPTIVFSNATDEEKVEKLFLKGVQVPRIDARDLSAVLEELYDRDIQSMLVEGGTEVAGAFVDARLVDKITLILAPIVLGGPEAPAAIGGNGALSLESAMKMAELTVSRLGPDIEITGYPKEP